MHCDRAKIFPRLEKNKNLKTQGTSLLKKLSNSTLLDTNITVECKEEDPNKRDNKWLKDNVLSPVESPENCCRIFNLRISWTPPERSFDVQDSLITNETVNSCRLNCLQAEEKKEKQVWNDTNLFTEFILAASVRIQASMEETYEIDMTSATFYYE